MVLKNFLLGLVLFMLQGACAQDWKTNLEDAFQEAEATEKAVLLVFSGSDWCAPCIKMEQHVWSSEQFKSYAKDHSIMVKADFPKRKKNRLSETQTARNNKLAAQYNRNGIFPLVVVFNSRGKVVGKFTYKKMEVSSYISKINEMLK